MQTVVHTAFSAYASFDDIRLNISNEADVSITTNVYYRSKSVTPLKFVFYEAKWN